MFFTLVKLDTLFFNSLRSYQVAFHSLNKKKRKSLYRFFLFLDSDKSMIIPLSFP